MVAINLNAAETYIEDTPLNLTDIVIADSATATATLTLSDAAAGALTTGTSGVVTSTYDSATGIWSASGAIADVNALLAAVTFTPAENFNGSFFIATSVSDDAGTATGSKLITGTAVNDAPVAFNDLVAGVEDIVIAGAVLGNDTDVDGDALTASVVSAPANGTVTLDTATGAFVYTPAANFNGTDSFTYQANDGTADSNVATVTLTVTPINDAPVAANDSYTTIENTALAVPAPGILGNDSDVDGDALTASVTSPPANGIVTLDVATGAFVYTPDANFNGTDSFTYEAIDGGAPPLTSNVATVTLTVTPIAPGILIDKFVNGQDANDVVAGSTVIFTYVVTNNGNVPLADVVVTDDKLGPITTFTGDANGDSLLDLTETWTYTQTATALAGQQTNVGTVTAQAGITVTAQDQATYFGDAPAIHIVKFVNGQDADSPTGPHVAAPGPVTFTYVVTNTGNVPLANVVVTDDNGTAANNADDFNPFFSGGDTNANGLLDLTETWTYADVTLLAVAGQQTNIATVTALDAHIGTQVTDDNPANYFGESPASDDFNGDGNSDVLWRQDGSGQVYVWEMNGLQTKGEGRVESVTNDWHIQGVGDFNGDFNSDFLWRQDSGPVYFWEMNGRQIKEEGSPPHAPVPNDWHIEGTGDFDGDFKSDILWRHDSGQVYLWEMDGLNVKAEGSVTHAPVTNDWQVQGVGDFNGDGNSDVLWRQDDSGQTYIWEMNGLQVTAEGAVAHAPVTNDWHVEGVGDFNGDGNSDVLWRQDGSGQVYVWEMNGQQVQAEGAVAHAPVTSDWHVESVNDFNGDGNSDVLWRQDGSGQVYVWQMNGQQVQAEGAVAHAPVTSDWHVFSDLNFI
jgi:hypothetical protein